MSYELVVWGATGFTGSLVARYLAQHYSGSLRWAIAGRNRAKLEALRAELESSQSPGPASSMGVEVASLDNNESILALVRKTRVVLSTAGPFTLLGEPLLAACVDSGVHYVDTTGETPWVRAMMDRYGERAERNECRVVPMCGFDSVPADIGSLVLANHARTKHGRFLDDVHAYVSTQGKPSGGTIASIFNIFEHARLADLRDPFLLNPDRRPVSAPSPVDREKIGLSFARDVRSWTVPFLMAGANTRVVRRSHALLRDDPEFYGPSFHYNESQRVRSLLSAVMVTVGLAVAMILMQFSAFRRCSRRFLPAPGQGPSAQQRAQSFFRYQLVGRLGGARPGSDAARAAAPAKVTATLVGGDPGYDETAKMVAEAALCIAQDGSELPERAGFLTPATGLGMRYVARLRDAGIGIEVGDRE
mmetsp:Transcript_2895/g.8841  ORF Transcript_2895/g.8841 Transcript_2895/m.8841 type:complete len:418 (+) Transcript_2895:1353-2606(+)